MESGQGLDGDKTLEPDDETLAGESTGLIVRSLAAAMGREWGGDVWYSLLFWAVFKSEKKKIFKMNTNVQEYAKLLNGLFKLSLYELSSSSLSSRTRKPEF